MEMYGAGGLRAMIAAGVILVLAAAFGCAPKTQQSEATTPSTAAKAPAAPTGKAPAAATTGVTKLAGDKTPTFTAKGVDGKTVQPSDFAGKILVMDFWATWCAPCCEKLKKYQPMSEKYKPQGVEFLVLSQDDTPETAKGWAKENKITIPIAMFNPEVQKALFPGEESVAIPRVRILDRKGAWRYSLESEAKASDVEDAIQALLAEK